MKKKLIIVNGVMGVGKTSVCRMLYKELDNSFWLDGDNYWMMNPFTVNEENKTMVLDNIIHILNNYIRNSSSKYIIFNWVIHTDEIMEEILKGLNTSNVEIYKITLMCSVESLVSRIKGDIIKGLRDEDNIRRSLERLVLYEKMNTIKIDTTNKELEEVVSEINKVIKEAVS